MMVMMMMMMMMMMMTTMKMVMTMKMMMMMVMIVMMMMTRVETKITDIQCRQTAMCPYEGVGTHLRPHCRMLALASPMPARLGGNPWDSRR